MCLAAPAQAHPVTYVSGKGNDQNDCFSPATPCRSFQRAVNQTVAGGEVKALDPADYFPVTINKSISLTGAAGAGIDTQGGTAVSIILSAGGIVRLDHLIINNVSGSGGTGVVAAIFATGDVTITHCTVKGYGDGITAAPGSLVIADTAVTDNGAGIAGGGSTNFVLDNVLVVNNKIGVIIPPKSSFSFARSTIENNGTGVQIAPPGTVALARSFGDNHIKGNGTEVSGGGTLTNVGTQ
jgi:hypothetical protein